MSCFSFFVILGGFGHVNIYWAGDLLATCWVAGGMIGNGCAVGIRNVCGGGFGLVWEGEAMLVVVVFLLFLVEAKEAPRKNSLFEGFLVIIPPRLYR